MRYYAVFLCVGFLAVFLAACTPRTQENHQTSPATEAMSDTSSAAETLSESSPATESLSETSMAGQSSLSEPQVEPFPSPLAELKIPGEITVYKMTGESGIFEPYKVPVDKDEVTLFDIAAAVQKQLDIKIPIKSITQQKGMVVLDIAESFINSYGKAEISQILTTLAATLQQNHRGFEWIQYQLDGETGVFGEKWDIPPLKLIEGSPEEFAAIRAGIPYEGLQADFWLETPIVETDEVGWQLTRFLAMLRLFDKDISSPAELENTEALLTALYATKHYSTDPDSTNGNYVPELKPFEAPAFEVIGFYEDWFWLKEHVEQSAKLLYGDDFTLRHEGVSKYRYIETLGVYTPPHMGGGYNVIPVIFHYEDLGDRYKIELAYIVGAGGYIDPDTNEAIPEEDLERYVQTQSRHREVVIRKLDNGRFAFLSHRYL